MKLRTPAVKAALAIVAVLIVSLSALPSPARAQDTTPTPLPLTSITFSGRVQSIDVSYIVVSGLGVDIRAVNVPLARLHLGAAVTIVGTLQSGLIVASDLRFDDDTTSTPAATPVPTDEPAATSVPVTPDPNNPAPNPTAPPQAANPRIVIEGPVRAISPTSIRVFEITIEVDPAVSDVSTIRVGDYVRVQGDVTIVNNTFNIVAVNIVVVNIQRRDSGRASVSQPPPPAPPAAQPSGRGRGRGSGSGGGSNRGSGSRRS